MATASEAADWIDEMAPRGAALVALSTVADGDRRKTATVPLRALA